MKGPALRERPAISDVTGPELTRWLAKRGEPAYLTCDAERLTTPRRYVAGSLRESAA